MNETARFENTILRSVAAPNVHIVTAVRASYGCTTIYVIGPEDVAVNHPGERHIQTPPNRSVPSLIYPAHLRFAFVAVDVLDVVD